MTRRSFGHKHDLLKTSVNSFISQHYYCFPIRYNDIMYCSIRLRRYRYTDELGGHSPRGNDGDKVHPDGADVRAGLRQRPMEGRVCKLQQR